MLHDVAVHEHAYLRIGAPALGKVMLAPRCESPHPGSSSVIDPGVKPAGESASSTTHRYREGKSKSCQDSGRTLIEPILCMN